jgi:hypothetical protein
MPRLPRVLAHAFSALVTHTEVELRVHIPRAQLPSTTTAYCLIHVLAHAFPVLVATTEVELRLLIARTSDICLLASAVAALGDARLPLTRPL